MSKFFLHALDETVIVVKHVVTVTHGLDHEGYRTDSFKHFKLKKDIERAKDNPELQTALEKSMAELYPEGEPRAADYYRTKVSLTDGSTYWVKESKDHVVALLMAS